MDLFAAIADPTRRKMIDMMAGGELAAGAFVEAFPKVSQPAISQHLKVLRECGIATVRAERQKRLYALSPEALAPIQAWLSPLAPMVENTKPVKSETAKPQKAAARVKPKPDPEPMLTLDLFG